MITVSQVKSLADERKAITDILAEIAEGGRPDISTESSWTTVTVQDGEFTKQIVAFLEQRKTAIEAELTAAGVTPDDPDEADGEESEDSEEQAAA